MIAQERVIGLEQKNRELNEALKLIKKGNYSGDELRDEMDSMLPANMDLQYKL